MKRREFIAATAALLVSPRRSLAQGTRRRVGFLAMDVVEPTVQKAWLDGLRNHGWIDGRNLIIEYRYAPSDDRLPALGRVDGFDQDEAESKRDERAVILRRLLASKCDTLEAFELADRLFDACPCLVECFRKEGGHILGVGSIRDCRTYSALARGVAI